MALRGFQRHGSLNPRLEVVRSLDHIGANFRGLVAIQDLRESNHPVLLHRAVQYDIEPDIASEQFAVAQIRDQTTAGRIDPMASEAKAPIECLSSENFAGAGRLLRRIENPRRLGWYRR